MERDYASGTADDITFFTGVEIERTPAYGMQTLFVTGIQPVEAIEGVLANQDVRHIFFGANHSFNPVFNDYAGWKAWEDMITYFLDAGYWCSLDIPLSAVEEFNDGGLNDFNQFIPQIRVPIPYIKLWNYNTMLKVDDKGFKATNPGVWCHNLHDLLDRNKFTSWDQYGNDEVIK
jgi:hypothetical protein